MIITRNNKISMFAANLLAKPNEIIQEDGGFDFNLPEDINDDTLTIIDLTGDSEFQEAYHGKSLAEWLRKAGMTNRVRHIELIVSDVCQPNSLLEVLYQDLHDYLDLTGHKNIEAHASFAKGCRGSFIIPNPTTNNWNLYSIPASVTYQYPKGYKPTTENLLRDFKDQLKLEIITNMRGWIRERCRSSVETPRSIIDENTRP